MSAERGWIADPPPRREHKPSHEFKWYKMMGARELVPQRRSLAAKSSSPHIRNQRR